MSTDSELARSGRAPAASACEPYRELIEAAVRLRRNATAIYQDLVELHGFTSQYASVKRFVGKLRSTPTPEEKAVIETAPGRHRRRALVHERRIDSEVRPRSATADRDRAERCAAAISRSREHPRRRLLQLTKDEC